MPRIVVVGSLNMDLACHVDAFPVGGETVQCRHFAVLPGGKGANQAVAAARLGAAVAILGCVGEDGYGTTLLGSLRANGVDTTYVMQEDTTSTGLAFITLNGSGENTIIVHAGANEACKSGWVMANDALIERADALIAQLEIPVSTVVTAFTCAKQHGVLTVFNPAPARHVPSELLRATDVLILNETEAEFYSGVYPSSTEHAIHGAVKLRKLGPRHVVVTLGEQGAVYVGEEQAFHMPAYSVPVVDTTGAGDGFVAAFTLAWLSGSHPQEALQQGCAGGAIAAMHIGTQCAYASASTLCSLVQEQPLTPQPCDMPVQRVRTNYISSTKPEVTL